MDSAVIYRAISQSFCRSQRSAFSCSMRGAYFAARVFFGLSPDSTDDLCTDVFFAAVMEAVFDVFSAVLAAALTDLDDAFFAAAFFTGFSSAFCAVRVRVVFFAADFAGALPAETFAAGVRSFDAGVLGAAVCPPSSCFGASGVSAFTAAAAATLGITAFFFATTSAASGGRTCSPEAAR